LHETGAAVSPMSINQFTAFVRGEIDRYQAIIKAADLKPE
jgi:tripartite-type tricarboxylate transporter receptor subunit TctC